ncbi:MAG: peptidoglycan editing factor PgeF [Muribaculaceae bacterium]|nr:peptidoglycan editing factor PgeF [Muribaculaceae bacterium]
MKKMYFCDNEEIEVYALAGDELKNREGGGSIPDAIDGIALNPVQTHSLNVAVVDEKTSTPIDDCDAYITFSQNLPIGVRTADCVPIMIYARDIKAVAAVHAGWKGTIGGIIDNVIKMLLDYGSERENIYIYFGPSISQKIYEVDADLAEKFIDAGFEKNIEINPITSKPHIDLEGVNIERVKSLGVPERNIYRSGCCTFESKDFEGNYLFPSYRRDKGTDRRLLTAVKLKS